MSTSIEFDLFEFVSDFVLRILCFGFRLFRLVQVRIK